ncbi:MAG: hypothetical protein ACI9UO_002716 [Nitrospinales bacterium]|jgi:hypothetical protein
MAHYNPFDFSVNKKSTTKNPYFIEKLKGDFHEKLTKLKGILTEIHQAFFYFFHNMPIQQKLTNCKPFQLFRIFIESDSIKYRAIFLARHCRIKYYFTISLDPHSTRLMLISLVLIIPSKEFNVLFSSVLRKGIYFAYLSGCGKKTH